jgi:hypothetical protein
MNFMDLTLANGCNIFIM